MCDGCHYFQLCVFWHLPGFCASKTAREAECCLCDNLWAKIGSRYMRQLVQFLKTESFSGRDFFESNFLNDGLISHEFVDTGLAKLILTQNAQNVKGELTQRFEKEKAYEPYRHPFSKQIHARGVWQVFAPEIEKQLVVLQHCEDVMSPQAIEARIDLYQSQRAFPSHFLANVLRYQEHDLAGVPSDPKLQRADVSLFGYQNLEDWFGPTFLDQAAKVLIETVALAQKKGYKVTEDEARSDMLYKSQKMCEAFKEKADVAPFAQDGRLLLQLFTRQTGFDEPTLVAIYRDVMLFKRFLQDAADSVMPDSLAFESFYARAGESVTLEVSQMPKTLRLRTKEDLNDFECYLMALGGQSAHPLLLPQQVSPRPEIAGTRYQIYCGCIEAKQLEAKVSIKEMWRWQEQNWPLLQKQFSWLQAGGNTLDFLDSLDTKRRESVDCFARQQIVKGHPQWLEEALKAAEMKPQEIFLAQKDPSLSSLLGIKDLQAFQQQLDDKDELFNYTQDQEHFYRILVTDRQKQMYLSFQEAKQAGILERLHAVIDSESRVRQVLAGIGREMAALGVQVSEEQAVWYRFYKQLTEGPSTLEQFQPVQQLLTVTRAEPRFFAFDQLMHQDRGDGANQVEGAYIYTVQERVIDKTLPLDKMVQASELLSYEVRYSLLKQILDNLIAEPV